MILDVGVGGLVEITLLLETVLKVICLMVVAVAITTTIGGAIIAEMVTTVVVVVITTTLMVAVVVTTPITKMNIILDQKHAKVVKRKIMVTIIGNPSRILIGTMIDVHLLEEVVCMMIDAHLLEEEVCMMTDTGLILATRENKEVITAPTILYGTFYVSTKLSEMYQ